MVDNKLGKLNKRELQRLLSYIKRDPRVLVPPLPGYDSGVHFLGDKCMVVSTDPCSDVPEEWFGWLLINYAASDVALFGAKPEFCSINLLGALGTKPTLFEKVMEQVCVAAEELNMVVVTGHTGTYKSLNKMVGVCTAYGRIDRSNLIMPSNIKSEDIILQIKEIGFEVLSNFSFMRNKLSKKLFGIIKMQKLLQEISMQSCVYEALKLADLGGVNVMHDITEGGLVSVLNELADCSGFGFQVENEKLLIKPEIKILQEYFSLSDDEILSMSSSGSLIATINPKEKDRILMEISKFGIFGRVIGKFSKNNKRIMIRNKKKFVFPSVSIDPYNKILSG